MYKKNDIIELDIVDMTKDGLGVAKLNEQVFFVKDSIIGDRIKAIITKNDNSSKISKIIYAKMKEIISPSKYRVIPKCKVCNSCGGCQIMDLNYNKQLELKTNMVKNNLIRIGGFTTDYLNEKFEGISGMTEPYNFRNKMQIPVALRDSRVVTGFYAGRTHYIVENEECVVGFDEERVLIDIVKKICKSYDMYNINENYNNIKKLTIYDEKTGNGILREIMIRKGNTTNEISLTLIVNDKKIFNSLQDNSKKESLLENYKNIANYILFEYDKCENKKKSKLTTITLNINIDNNNVLFGKQNIVLYGDGFIRDEICGLSFNISPQSFYQINNKQTEVLYNTALSFIDEFCNGVNNSFNINICSDNNMPVLRNAIDLYCGIGTITLLLAKKVERIVGIEIVDEAINNAKINSKMNSIENTEFICADADSLEYEHLSKLIEKNENISNINKKNTYFDLKNVDLISVDPPRKGLDFATINLINKISPKYLLYISCDFATLSRDLKILCDKQNEIYFDIKKIKCVDMFPHTTHVETVVLMSRVNK